MRAACRLSTPFRYKKKKKRSIRTDGDKKYITGKIPAGLGDDRVPPCATSELSRTRSRWRREHVTWKDPSLCVCRDRRKRAELDEELKTSTVSIRTVQLQPSSSSQEEARGKKKKLGESGNLFFWRQQNYHCNPKEPERRCATHTRSQAASKTGASKVYAVWPQT